MTKIFYLCNRKDPSCKGCNPACKYTSDIRYSKNFRGEVSDDYDSFYFENDTSSQTDYEKDVIKNEVSENVK